MIFLTSDAIFVHMYLPRGLEQAPDAFHQAPVTILEGRRAVGKTALVRHLVDKGDYASYADLTDEMTRTRADNDLHGWLTSLAKPTAIDEAQLIPELATAVKRIVDATDSAPHQFLLTGSSVVGRGTMGGSDPLAGRSARLQLLPFTRAELTHPQAGVRSLIDLLFDGPVDAIEAPRAERTTLIRDLRQGGIPAYCLPTQLTTTSQLNARVQADISSLLGDRLVPGESFDGARAQRILDAVVRTPGGILNKSRLAGDLGIDVRTLTAYLDILERRFLLTQLHNVASGPSGATRSRPKVHPADTSLACESLARAGHDISDSPELLGQVLESWVVQQVCASRGWSRLNTHAFYWRDAKTQAEVDLALVDGEGRIVGLEVKAAQSVTGRDLRGLKAMADGHPGLHRGFIVYTGTELAAMAPGIWAIPISLIRDPGLWGPAPRSTARNTTRPQEHNMSTSNNQGEDGSLFLSYVHDDDTYMGGAIRAFAQEVSSAYRFLTGRTVELFIDRHDIAWGEAWQQRIMRQLADSTFLLAMVTPAYVRSQACRDEVMAFQAGDPARQRLLALIVREPDAQAPDVRDNPAVSEVMREIGRHQYLKPDQALEDLEVGSAPFKKAARRVAEGLRDAVANQRVESVAGASTVKADDSDDEGLMEILDTLQETTVPALLQEMATFQTELESFGAAFQSTIPAGAAVTPRSLVIAARRLDAQRKSLDDATTRLTGAWERFNTSMLQAARLSEDPSVQAFAPGLLSEFQGASIEMDESALLLMRHQIQGLSKMSKALRPAVQAFGRALDMFLTIKGGVEAWAE